MSGDGYIVTLEGHQTTITEQLRLLPFSENILCLPPLDLPPAPPVRESLNSSDQLPPLDPAVRRFILSLHHAHVARLEKAKSFLADRQHGGERMVFLNGGFAAAQVACLETLRNALVSEENGNLENAAREAEWVFEDIVQGGVQGLLDLDDREQVQDRGSVYGTVEIGHIPSDVESISTEKQREGAPPNDFERELFQQPLDTITPELTPDNTPKIPELIEIRRSPSPQKDRKPRVVSVLRNPTPEEIAAGVEICKASVAVRVRSRSNTTTTIAGGAKYSPPPSPPPIVRTEFLLGQHGSPEKRSEPMSLGFAKPIPEKPRASGRKERANNLTLPPIESMYSAAEIPTPPSSAKAIPNAVKISQFPMFSGDYRTASPAPVLTRPDSCGSTRPSSPTPSSTADISGATILPSPRYLSGGFDAPPRFLKDPVDPLFPSVGENLVIYLPSLSTQNSQFLEKVLSDFAVSFTPQTPGIFRSNPRVPMFLNGRNEISYLSPVTAQFTTNRESFQSVTSSISARSWPYRSSINSHHPDPPLSSIPTISLTSEKSPADIQNELRTIMRHHFPPSSSPSPTVTNKAPYSPIDDDEDEDEDMHWLTEDTEIDNIWRPVLSRRGIDEGHAYSAIDLIVAVAAEEGGESTESRKGLELRRRLVEQVEEMSRKKGKGSCVAQVGLKYLLSNALPHMRVQHPSTKDSAVLKGHFLLPELESYLSLNTNLRVVVVEFDYNTGSSAILELQRVLGPNVDVLKIACIADGVTQFASKPQKPSKSHKTSGSTGIRIRTSINATTISYTLGPSTPTSPTAPNSALRVFPSRKPLAVKLPGKRPLVPKQRLISRADVVIPPFATPSSGPFIDAVQALHMSLMNREKMTGFYGGSKENEDQVPATPGIIVGSRRIETEREREMACRQDTSYYLEEETDEEENHEGRRASFRRRVKNGSKALKWLGLE